jgi:hypothetical protein
LFEIFSHPFFPNQSPTIISLLFFQITVDYFRFFISPTLKGCICRRSGLTFEIGQVASDEVFDVETIEIFGCGGEHASQRRKERKDEERQFQESRRTVDKKQFLDGFTTEFLLGDTFKHRQEQQERE